MATDPGGCWVAVDGDDRPIGVALALVREGVWGLSLLVVRPDVQSAGAGGALLRAALGHGRDARGGDHPRLVRPARPARLPPRGLHDAPGGRAPRARRRASSPTRPCEPFDAGRDAAMAAAVDRAVRGAAHGADLEALARERRELLALPGRGYAAHRDGEVKLAGRRRRARRRAALLRTALARAPAGRPRSSWLTGAQRWAVDVVVEARLELDVWGAVFLRGDVGPFRPTSRAAPTSERPAARWRTTASA